MKIYKQTEMLEVPHKSRYYEEEYHRTVCPECKDHPQGDAKDVLDCHNEYTFTTDVLLYGKREVIRIQCCCYSEVHGKQERMGNSEK